MENNDWTFSMMGGVLTIREGLTPRFETIPEYEGRIMDEAELERMMGLESGK